MLCLDLAVSVCFISGQTHLIIQKKKKSCFYNNLMSSQVTFWKSILCAEVSESVLIPISAPPVRKATAMQTRRVLLSDVKGA